MQSVPVRPLQMPGADDLNVVGSEAPAEGTTAQGAPIGAAIGGNQERPPDDQDRSLDFGPEG